MSREYYRPYTKVLQIADNTTKHTVDFRDTGANLIRCNYITVTAASGAADGIFSVVVSGLDLTVSAPHQSLAVNIPAAGIGTSGTCGLVANQNGGSVVISLAAHESAAAVILSQSIATDTAYAISYGIVTEANNRADNSLHGAYGGFNGVGT